MNIKIILCIAMGALVAHIAVVMILFHFRTDSLPPPSPPPVRNFRVAEEKFVDPTTGEKLIHREIRVSTKLAPGGDAGRKIEPLAK
jgi:hypothetical protein